MAYRTVRARRADGSEFVADVSVRRVHDLGVPLTLLVARDGSARAAAEQERRALEDRLRQARQQEALAALCGGVAHELNSVLTAVLGYTEAARERIADRPAAVGDLRLAEGAVYRARMLVDQLLAYAGRARPHLRPNDLAALLTDLPRAAADQLGRPVPIDVRPGPDPLSVQADADQLGHALVQLVANATDAAGPENTPEIRTGRETLGPAELAAAQVNPDVPPGPYAYVEVADAGPGMTAEVLARAFEPFFTTRPRGRGLGLSVVAGVVKAHGGALRVRTAPGAGTTVRLWLPLAAPEVPAPAPAARFRAGTRVLVVDDEDLVRGVVKAMLERRGCAVLTAANGSEAVDLFRREAGRVDAVLLDLNMPVMDGERALEEIRALNPAVAVWIMTGYDPAGREERLAGHVRGVLRKPVSSETLFGALSVVLGP
jgi:two-component system cell cycle sensor histidine kinase/response regulator CckA